jgi:hypothetical protein
MHHTRQTWHPCDFWLFPKITLTMKKTRFDTIAEIEGATKER